MKETEYARAMKDQAWVKNSDIAAQACAPGVERKVLAFTDGLMCVENHFMEGARGRCASPSPYPDNLRGIRAV